MKRPISLLICLVLVAAASGCARVYEERRFVFETDNIAVDLRLYGRGAPKAAEEMFALFDELGKSADTTDRQSDVSRFNAAAVGETVSIGSICFALIRQAEELYEATDGAFNAASMRLSKLWQVDAESIHAWTPRPTQYPYPSPETLPAYADVTAALETAAPSSWTLRESGEGYTITKNAPVEIDLGAVAKGWAADRCAEIAAKHKLSARIDVSGNLYLVGKYFNDKTGRDEDWYIGVTDPRPRPSPGRGYVTVLHSEGDVSFVTSGDYERYYFYQNELAVSHIIGRDGLPIGLAYDGEAYYNTGTQICSATVVGPSSLLCDAYATAVSVMELEEAMRFLNGTGYGALLFTDDGKMAVRNVEQAYEEAFDGYKSYTEVVWTA